jgi:hypothetical protein
MDAKTRAKAKRAETIVFELYELLGELERELSVKGDFAGYLLVHDVKEQVFLKTDATTKLHAVATMGLKDNG